MTRTLTTIAFLLLSASASAAVQSVINSGVEPDDFATGQALTFVNPRVDLFTFDMTNVNGNAASLGFPAEFGNRLSSIIPVTSLEATSVPEGPLASTGNQIFGHAGVGFTPDIRAIGMRFNGLANEISIDAIGSGSPLIGVLDVYDSNRQLIERVTSGSLGSRDIETLSAATPDFDIAFAIAYSDPNFSPFGRFDNLRFTTIPEPSTLLLVGMAIPAVCAARIRQLLRR